MSQIFIREHIFENFPCKMTSILLTKNVIIFYRQKIQVINIMVEFNIAMHSVFKAESVMTIHPLQYAL